MQRVISNISAGLHNNPRVNSVNKDMNMEITTIEEIISHPNKYKKGRHIHTHKDGKGDRAEFNSKKDIKNVKSKYKEKRAHDNIKQKSEK